MEANLFFDEDERRSNGAALKSEVLPKIMSVGHLNNIVPIISNSFRIEQIFRTGKSLSEYVSKKPVNVDEELTISEQLTRVWANKIQYPMPDDYKLWLVAQYYQVNMIEADTAKENYLTFLKRLLFEINEDKEGYQEFVSANRRTAHKMSFSAIAKGLDLPSLDGKADPLSMLAELPFPVYITTSQYDFLERAIERVSEGKRTPRTQVIFWEPNKDYPKAMEARHYPDPSFQPSPDEPAVYHLYGMENYPGSLVLSEDDYIRFLISVVSDHDTQNPVVPPKLRRTFSTAHLLLMGYRLRDWDFRVLFRVIQHWRQNDSKMGICIQLKPKSEDEKLLTYLRDYFNLRRFGIEWKSTVGFIRELWELWQEQQQ